MKKILVLCTIALLYLFTHHGFAMAEKPAEVVVYTALDQIFSEPILKGFEEKYHIKVRAVYDVEAVKTVGLVNRLIAEKDRPQCDVFWNNEILRTISLKRKEILAPYQSPSANEIPAQFKDKDGYWSGFAARARVLVVNTNLVDKKDYPSSIEDLSDPRWRGKCAIANPLFGTTSTHVAALFATRGSESATTYLVKILANDVKVADGNAMVRDMTARGEVLFGLTDTDDVNVGITSGLAITMIPPDQQVGGTLLIPNTVALIKGAPHQKEAKLLIDYILSSEVEEKLAHCESAQIPLRPGIKIPKGQLAQGDISSLAVDYEKMADALDQSISTVQRLFLR